MEEVREAEFVYMDEQPSGIILGGRELYEPVMKFIIKGNVEILPPEESSLKKMAKKSTKSNPIYLDGMLLQFKEIK